MVKSKKQREKRAKQLVVNSKRKLNRLGVRLDAVVMESLNADNQDTVNAMKVDVANKLHSPFEHKGNI